MPRQYLGEIPITRGGALLRRYSSPVQSEWPVPQEENHDAFVDRLEREASSVFSRMRQLSVRVTERSAEWRQLSARVTERSADWRRLRFGSSVRRRRWQRSAPQPSNNDEQGLDEYDEMDTEASTEIESEADQYVDDYNDAATRGTTTPRLSMPMGSDDDDGSGSDPDLSVLAMARGGGRSAQAAMTSAVNTREEQMLLQQQAEAMAYEEEVMSQGQYEAEETSIGEQVEDDEDEEEQEEQEEQEILVDPASIGLKEISNLGKFTVSSHKPGNGVAELRSDDLKLYWQSDGPQPHKLTVYFIKRVGIRVIRFFVDYQEDESYTPTKIVFKSGTSENNMIEFATMTMDSPYGWQDVPIEGAGGEPDGNTLVSYVLQMQILENHQNGKDTHLRGIKIYAFDPDSGHQQASGRRQRRRRQDEAGDEVAAGSARVKGRNSEDDDDGGVMLGGTSSDRLSEMARILAESTLQAGDGGFSAADFLREPELR
ncbi:anaphase promoting complex subunit 10 [Cordyceps fumosorosea ARSEF 2679]|uniref:Anaphase promoting complex subunit 10 n=1 Tax=Cordyceps fumosorosea (strain ARSEF 2679) TaxID=1081104 RepID=A0A167W136_CORFA|nr:anaphase promoting complex subunit 10 [Cordyceps fumosorosea ARSEF 2679]OAA63204.1 anaphase promoting complex subunit 10 [Cordyceps fumosorosea ARSEF 2679]